MNSRLAVAVAGALVLLAAAGSYLYFFSGLRSAPRALALATPTGQSATVTPAAAPSGPAGTWTVSPGSVARYRVEEVFAGAASSHQAVAETSDLSGSLTIEGAAGQARLASLTVTGRLTGLHSIDSVAGFNVSQRDRIVQGQLQTSQYPDATFSARDVQLPADLSAGGIAIPGQLTLHGVTRPETITLKQVQAGETASEVVGQTSFNMTDFGVQPPSLPITKVQPDVVLEFDLKLARS